MMSEFSLRLAEEQIGILREALAQLAEENAKLKRFVHWVHKDECASLLADNKPCDCGLDEPIKESG